MYFANLPLNFKEHDLENLLSKYGSVVSTRVLRDEVNISKGVGFARFVFSTFMCIITFLVFTRVLYTKF